MAVMLSIYSKQEERWGKGWSGVYRGKEVLVYSGVAGACQKVLIQLSHFVSC